MRINRKLRLAAAVVFAACALALIAGVIALYALQTNWFRQQARERILAAAETSTGGRVQFGSFTYNWRTLSAEFTDFVIHGSEPAGAPPLFETRSLRISLRIVSLLRREIDVASVTAYRPGIHLYIRPDGKLNNDASRFLEQLLNLKVRHLEFKDGLVDVNAPEFPLTASAGHLTFSANYSARHGEYSIALKSPSLRLRDFSGSLNAALHARRDRLAIDDLLLQSGNSKLSARGSLEHFANPTAILALDAQFAADAAHAIGISGLRSGELGLNGNLRYDTPSGLSFAGDLEGRNLLYNSGALTLKNVTLNSHVIARPDEIMFDDLRLNPFGGTLSGNAVLKHRADLQFTGQFHGWSLRSTAVLLPVLPVPWSGTTNGTLHVSGTLGRRDFLVQTAAHIVPAPAGIPLSGDVNLLYRQSSGALSFDESHLILPHTQISFSGTAEKNLQLSLTSTNLMDFNSVATGVQLPTLASNGGVRFDGTVSGPLTHPYITGNLTAAQLNYETILWTQLHSRILMAEGGVDFSSLIADSNLVHITGSGHLGLNQWVLQPASALRLNAQFERADLARLSSAFLPPSVRVARGAASGSVNLSGSLADPRGSAILRADNLDTYGGPASSVRLEASFEPGDMRITRGTLRSGGAMLIFSGDYQHPAGLWQGGEINLKADSNGFPLTTLAPVRNYNAGLQALVETHLRASAHLTPNQLVPTHAEGSVVLREVTINHVPYGSFTAGLSTYGQTLDADFSGSLRDTRLSGRAHIQLAAGLPSTGDMRLDRISLPTLYALTGAHAIAGLPFDGFLQGGVTFSGPLQHPDQMQGTVKLDQLQLSSSITTPSDVRSASPDLVFRNSAPVVLDAANGIATIRSLELSGRNTSLSVRGSIPYSGQRAMNLSLHGSADLRLFQLLDPNMRSSGQSLIDATVHGTLADPLVAGSLQVKDGSFFLNDVPNGLTGVNGAVNFDRDRATIQDLTAKSGGGDIALGGSVTYGRGPLVYRLEANAKDVRIRWAGSVSVTGNATLRLTGTSKSSILSGTLTVARAAFTPSTDVGNLIAAAGAPSASPANSTDFLTGLQFDLHIENAPDLELSTSLSRDVQASVDLRLRGTPAHPVLLGTVAANQGDIKVFGTKYSINRGEVSFQNPVKIEPVVNLDLQTQARGIIVDITISGTPGKLNINYRSDPPLQPRDIIALLTVGHTPDIAANISNTQTTSQFTALQSGANTVLGAAMSPNSSRLQKLFGVANIKIDPMVQGITNTMQRLTIEQQISRNITVTYVTNLSQTSEQIFRFEWALSPQYSLVALRDDNGEFGIDIQYKKRFK
jgi:translocation and assembly module TamB